MLLADATVRKMIQEIGDAPPDPVLAALPQGMTRRRALRLLQEQQERRVEAAAGAAAPQGSRALSAETVCNLAYKLGADSSNTPPGGEAWSAPCLKPGASVGTGGGVVTVGRLGARSLRGCVGLHHLCVTR